MAFGVGVTGQKQVMKNLSTLAERTQRKILGKVVRRVQKPMVGTARKNLQPHRRTGQLRKSLGTVIRRYKRTMSVWAVLGPRGGFRVEDHELYGTIDPVNYAHLLELGTRNAPAYPFLQPAFQLHQAQAKSSAIAEIAAEIEKEAAKQANR